MRRAYGFTLIEVLITVTVMVILLILAVVSVSGTEAKARDEKRKTDISVIAQQLETYYTSGTDTSTAIGEYPDTSSIATETQVTTLLHGIDPQVLRAPGVASTSTMSFVVASGNSTTAPAPTPTISSYVYQPLTSTGVLCNSPTLECRKFNLYYVLEGTSGVQTLASKNQ